MKLEKLVNFQKDIKNSNIFTDKVLKVARQSDKALNN
jgi:hypothetical protein